MQTNVISFVLILQTSSPVATTEQGEDLKKLAHNFFSYPPRVWDEAQKNYARAPYFVREEKGNFHRFRSNFKGKCYENHVSCGNAVAHRK